MISGVAVGVVSGRALSVEMGLVDGVGISKIEGAGVGVRVVCCLFRVWVISAS